MKYVLAALFFGALVLIYIGLYLMNKRTPLPEGCENLRAECEGCHDFACSNHPAHREKGSQK